MLCSCCVRPLSTPFTWCIKKNRITYKSCLGVIKPLCVCVQLDLPCLLSETRTVVQLNDSPAVVWHYLIVHVNILSAISFHRPLKASKYLH